MGLYAIPSTDLLDTFTETLCVRYDNMTLGFNFISGGLGTCGVLVVSPISNPPGGPIKPFPHLGQSPFGYLHCVNAFLRWAFSLGKLRIATHCLGPMVEGFNNTKFG